MYKMYKTHEQKCEQNNFSQILRVLFYYKYFETKMRSKRSKKEIYSVYT